MFRTTFLGAVCAIALTAPAMADVTLAAGDFARLIPAPGITPVPVMVTSVFETDVCEVQAHLMYLEREIAGLDAGHICLGDLVAVATGLDAGLVVGMVYAVANGTGLIIIE